MNVIAEIILVKTVCWMGSITTAVSALTVCPDAELRLGLVLELVGSDGLGVFIDFSMEDVATDESSMTDCDWLTSPCVENAVDVELA